MTALVLVTGSNGFVGSHLTETLLAAGYRVRCMVRRTSDLTWLNALRHTPTGAQQVEWAYADVTDEAALREVVAGVDAVCHFGALTRAPDEATYQRVNAGGTENLLAACLQAGVDLRRFVLCSSQTAAGPSDGVEPLDETAPPRPLTWYGRSKLAAEEAVHRYADLLPVTILRPAAVFGPRDRDVLAYFRLVKRGLSLQLGRGERWVSLIYVRDLVALALLALEKPEAVGQTYFACDGQAYTWGGIAGAIALALDRRPLYVTLPEAVLGPMAWAATTLARLTGQTPLLHEQRLIEMRQRAWLCSNDKARRELGFEPAYSLSEAVAETTAWYQQAGWL